MEGVTAGVLYAFSVDWVRRQAAKRRFSSSSVAGHCRHRPSA
jgi:hypothetical protein